MIDAAVRSVLAVEGPATFVTTGPQGPHLVATWQSYLDVLDDHTLVFPAGGYRQTEANLEAGSPVQMMLGARGPEIAGGALGFRLRGTAELQSGNAVHERVRARFPWCRAAVVFRVTAVEKVLG